MRLEFHDAEPPTLAGKAEVDYEYQAEQHVIDAESDYPHIVRMVLDGGRREWRRVDGKFVETTPPLKSDEELKQLCKERLAGIGQAIDMTHPDYCTACDGPCQGTERHSEET